MSPPPPQELLTTLEDFKEVNTSYKEKQTDMQCFDDWPTIFYQCCVPMH